MTENNNVFSAKVTSAEPDNSLRFTNRYPTEGTLVLTKNVTNVFGAADSFTFHIASSNLPEQDLQKWANDHDYDFVDGKLVITTDDIELTNNQGQWTVTLNNFPTGTYTITEVDNDGYSTTYQAGSAAPTVEVQSVDVVTDETSHYTVNNTRLTGSLKVEKQVVGGSTEKEFTFTGTPSSDVNAAEWAARLAVEGNSNSFTLKHGESTSIEDLPTGNYTVTENDVPAGYTATVNDVAATTADLTVTADALAEITFTNTYSTTPATAVVSFNKMLAKAKDYLTAPDITGQYTFTLEAVTEGAPMPAVASVTNPDGDGGAMSFGPISYTTPGEYEYTITESGAVEGVTNDANLSRTVKVTVVDNGNGTLSATVSAENGTTFTNTYTADPTDAQIKVNKVLNGRELAAGEFEFELLDANGERIDIKTNAADGTVTFDEITYDAEDTYKYTVKEIAGNLGGVTYDSKEIEVVVTIVDNLEGELEVESITYTGDATFTNTYEADETSAQVEVNKILTGRDMVAGEFEFVLYDQDGNEVGTATNTANGKVRFDAIDFDAAGTYTYTVKETEGDRGGVSYDDKEIIVTVQVNVIDNQEGELEIESMTYTDNATFINTYEAAETIAQIEVNKVLIGRELAAAEFAFSLIDESGNVLETKRNDSDGNVQFTAITYHSAGTYHYQVHEVNDSKPGVNYDDSVVRVTVNVIDNLNGNLVAMVSYVGGDSSFENSYQAEQTSAKIAVNKILTGRELVAGEFSFELLDSAGNVIETKVNDAEGNVDFNAITYTSAGIYSYQVREVSGDKGGISYDNSTVNVTVTVIDNLNGELVAMVNYENGDSTFENTYVATGNESVAVHINKKIVRAEDDSVEITTMPLSGFLFEVYKVTETGEEKVGGTVATDTNGHAVIIIDGIDRVGDFTYVLREVPGNNAGMIYASDNEFTVHVEDSLDGTFNVSVEGAGMIDDSGITFEVVNQYRSGCVELMIPVLKTIDNQSNSPVALDGFTFVLSDGVNEWKAVSNAEGSAAFKLSFADLIEKLSFEFTLTEEIGDIPEMEYSTKCYELVVEVDCGEDGVWFARVICDGQIVDELPFEFVNVKLPETVPPQTGDNASIGLWMLLSMASLAGVVILSKRKA